MKIKMVRYGLLHEKYTLYDIDNMIIEYHNFNDQYGDISRDLEIINYGYTKSVQLAPFMLSFLRNIRLPFNFDLYVDDVKTEGGDEILREVLQAMPYEFKDIIVKCLVLIKNAIYGRAYLDFDNIFRIVTEELPKEMKRAEMEYDLNGHF